MSEVGRPGTDEDVATALRRSTTVRLAFNAAFVLTTLAALPFLATAAHSLAFWIVVLDVLLRGLMLVWSQVVFRRDDEATISAGAALARHRLRDLGEKQAKSLASPNWVGAGRTSIVYALLTAALVALNGRDRPVAEVLIALAVANVIEPLVSHALVARQSAHALRVAGPVSDAELREIASGVLAAEGRAAAVGYVTGASRRHIDDAMSVVDSLPASKRCAP